MDTLDEIKEARKQIQEIHDNLAKSPRKNRSRSIALTKLDEAYMWLGRDLEEPGFMD